MRALRLGSTRRRRFLLGGALVGAGLVATTLLLGRWQGPRERYRLELADKVEDLVRELREFGPGTKDLKLVGGGTVPSPRSFAVAQAAQAVVEHFGSIPFNALEEDLRGFDAWSRRLKDDLARHRARVDAELARIAADLKSNPDKYASDWTAIGIVQSALLRGEPSVGTTRDGKLYFVYLDRRVLAGEVLALDIDSWLGDVRSKAMEVQGVTRPAATP